VRARSGLPLVLLALGVAGCLTDAERGNPLDPLSDNFRDVGDVSGAVVRASRPSEGVPGATVHLAPAGGGPELVAPVSDAGAFTLDDVPSGTYALTAEAPGYAPADTTVTVVATEATPSVVLLLNALPRVVDQAVHTERINRLFPPPETFSRLFVEAAVADPDGLGDLVSVDLIIPDFGFREPLLAVAGEEGTFTRTFTEDELPVGLQDLLGRNLFIEVTDRDGATARSVDTHVTRIVESIPVAISPQYDPDAPIRPPFEMTWEPLTLPYTFTWRVEIYFVPVPGQEVPALTFEGIPSTQTRMTMAEELGPGDYQWFVSAVDVFGNLARSPAAGFRIAPSSG
jgi:hypothetical protein